MAMLSTAWERLLRSFIFVSPVVRLTGGGGGGGGGGGEREREEEKDKVGQAAVNGSGTIANNSLFPTKITLVTSSTLVTTYSFRP